MGAERGRAGPVPLNPETRATIDELLDGVSAAIARGLSQRQREQLAWMVQTDVTDVSDTRMLDSLARRGLVESYEHEGIMDPAYRTCWRITDAGRRALAGEQGGGDADA